jgi:tetratricopeptide (TPR) repeat protein
MRSHVFTDARLGRLAGRFVWLEVNGEEERNAAFLEQYPVDAWPTLFVIDPATATVVMRWAGSAGVAELERMLFDVERSHRAPSDPAAAALARADRLNGSGDAAGAEAAYRDALARGGPKWARRPRAVESLVVLLALKGTPERCADAARAEAPALPRGPSFANVVANGLYCAMEMPADGAARGEALDALEPLAREALELPALLADDRAGLFDAATSAASDRGDEARARELAERWWRFLEEEGRRAKTPEARAALDTSRLAAAVALGDPARALPALLASERDLPKHLDSPYRLASAYRLLGRHEEALAANDRALALTKGPRRLRVFQQRAMIAQAMGDVAAARRALEDALAFEARLPAAQRSPRVAGELRATLARLEP